ncbi:hypothetical protein [Aureimonas mangrovi]|uniref:hypothetical protein n=1 Tax=Aureimonas mangrovi TaxID=2758041 RepID=UPI00163DA4DF|nr:hypothetical protein [Aureimonas mangrovi]
MIRFFDKAVQRGKGEDGLPIYTMVPYFEAYKSAVTRVVRPARGGDKVAHPNEWKDYLASREPDHEGFPLAAWPQIDEADRKGLAERGIHTLEKLIETDMSSAPSELRDAQSRARDFIERTHDDAPRLAAHIAELEASEKALLEDNNELRADVARLTSELDKAQAAPAQSGGKPKGGAA